MPSILLTRRGLLAVFLIPLCALCGCQGRGGQPSNTSGARAMLVSVAPSPPRTGPAELVIALTDPSGQPISGASLRLEGDMNMAGMRPVFGTLTDQGNGRYASHGFSFSMGGDWILTVTGTTKDGKTVAQTIAVHGVSGFAAPQPRVTPWRAGPVLAAEGIREVGRG